MALPKPRISHNHHIVSSFLDLSETQSLLINVKLHIVRAHEHVTKNEQRSCWRRDIHAQKRKQALATTSWQRVVCLSKRVLLASDDEVNVWCICVAVDGVLLVERGN